MDQGAANISVWPVDIARGEDKAPVTCQIIRVTEGGARWLLFTEVSVVFVCTTA